MSTRVSRPSEPYQVQPGGDGHRPDSRFRMIGVADYSILFFGIGHKSINHDSILPFDLQKSMERERRIVELPGFGRLFKPQFIHGRPQEIHVVARNQDINIPGESWNGMKSQGDAANHRIPDSKSIEQQCDREKHIIEAHRLSNLAVGLTPHGLTPHLSFSLRWYILRAATRMVVSKPRMRHPAAPLRGSAQPDVRHRSHDNERPFIQ